MKLMISNLGSMFYIYRFIIIIVVIIILLVLLLTTKVKFVYKSIRFVLVVATVLSVTILAVMIAQVELGSPFSKPSVTESQANALITKIKIKPTRLKKAVESIGEIRPDKEDDSFTYVNGISIVFIDIYDETDYWENYDIIDGIHESRYDTDYNYPVELKRNGYFELVENNVRIICYPIYYPVISKLSNIYIPFSPIEYREQMIVEVNGKVFTFISCADKKSQLGLQSYLQLLLKNME